jgi:hypothetical protein
MVEFNAVVVIKEREKGRVVVGSSMVLLWFEIAESKGPLATDSRIDE